MIADYDLVRGASNTDAKATTADARRFIDANMKKWKFYDLVTHELDD